MSIEIRINELLEARGKTAYWLAKEAGINHTTLSQIRHNQNKAINLDYLDRICEALEFAPGDVLVRADEKKKSTSRK